MSLARAIRRAAPVPFLHAAVDTFTDMFDRDVVEGEELSAECDQAGVAIFHRALPALLSTRFPVIIDHVLQEEGWYREYRAALVGHRVLYVGVHCPLDILREREISRRDRPIGLAEWQLPRDYCHAPTIWRSTPPRSRPKRVPGSSSRRSGRRRNDSLRWAH
jgi:chloramphenicol 3-O phosphotransferase